MIQAPTFNANNETVLGINPIANFNRNLKIYPNPTNSIVTFSNDEFSIESVKVMNIQGRILFQKNYQNQNNIELDMSTFSNGIYLVKVNNQSTIKIIKN